MNEPMNRGKWGGRVQGSYPPFRGMNLNLDPNPG
jgi:hypothetical protein